MKTPEPTLFFCSLLPPRSIISPPAEAHHHNVNHQSIHHPPSHTHNTQRDHREASSDTSGLRGGQITPSSGEEENQDWLGAIAYAEIDLDLSEESLDCSGKAICIVGGGMTSVHLASHAIKTLGAERVYLCLLYTSPSPRDLSTSRMPSSA